MTHYNDKSLLFLQLNLNLIFRRGTKTVVHKFSCLNDNTNNIFSIPLKLNLKEEFNESDYYLAMVNSWVSRFLVLRWEQKKVFMWKVLTCMLKILIAQYDWRRKFFLTEPLVLGHQSNRILQEEIDRKIGYRRRLRQYFIPAYTGTYGSSTALGLELSPYKETRRRWVARGPYSKDTEPADAKPSVTELPFLKNRLIAGDGKSIRFGSCWRLLHGRFATDLDNSLADRIIVVSEHCLSR